MTLTVWDNQGKPREPVEKTITFDPNGSNDIYLWDIDYKIKRTGAGATLIITVLVRYGPQDPGLCNSNDPPLEGAVVNIELSESEPQPSTLLIYTGEGTTNQDGEVTFTIRGLSNGTYNVVVTDIWHPDDKEWYLLDSCPSNKINITI